MRAEVHAVFRFGASVVHVARASLDAVRRRGPRAIAAPALPPLPAGLVSVDARGALTVLGEPLALGARRVVSVESLEVELSHEDAGAPAVEAVEPMPVAHAAPRPVLSNGLSIALHGALLAALALFAPPPDEADLRADREELATRLDARFAAGVADEDAFGASGPRSRRTTTIRRSPHAPRVRRVEPCPVHLGRARRAAAWVAAAPARRRRSGRAMRSPSPVRSG